MSEHPDELDRLIAKCLREAGGDPDKACTIADRYFDCGYQLMEWVYRNIRIAAAAAAASPTSRH